MDASAARPASQSSGKSPQEQAREVWNDTRDTARAVIGEQQQAAAGSLGDFAQALRKAARESGDGSAAIGRIAESAADGLQRVSDSLRGKDLDSLVRDAESFARRQPLAFIGTAALVGYLAVRFLKASDPSRQQQDLDLR
ncbi:MAG TPA: hypothetical protein VD965_01880 [Burkholderiales bacterium]|nr:hypothetical protein [Burkholderiales bacterium]